jgi:hypothetical protein
MMLSKCIRGWHFIDPFTDQTEVFFDKINIGDAKTIEVPIVDNIDERLLLLLRDIVITRTKVAFTEFLPIEGNGPHIEASVLEGMQEAPYCLFSAVQEPQVFTAVNNFIPFALILRFNDTCSKAGQVFRPLDHIPEDLRPAPQTTGQ